MFNIYKSFFYNLQRYVFLFEFFTFFLFLFGRAGSACAFAMLSVISLRSFIRYSEVVSFLLTFPPARRRAIRSNFAALARASYQQKRKQRSTNL